MSSLFAGMGKVKSNQGGVYFLPGVYRVAVKAVKHITSRMGVQTVIVECEVLESNNPQRPVGGEASYVISFRPDILDTAKSNLKAFAAAVLDITDPDSYVPDDGTGVDEFWEQAALLLVGSDQAAAGKELKLTCTSIKTKKDKDFTKHTWAPVA